jgi:nitrogen fixation protein NifB
LDYIDLLKELRVNNITVTVNALDPEVGEKIYNFVNYKGTIYKGKEAAGFLISRQLEGVKAAVKAGFILKINTVLIPEINMEEIEEIARVYSSLGIKIMNIIPLIPICEMKDKRAPTCDELKEVRLKCEPYVAQFRKCQQCRADAVGIPGIHGAGNACLEKDCNCKEKAVVASSYFHG